MSKIAIATGMLNEFTDAKVKELFEQRPWMEGKKFTLLYKTTEIEQYIDHCIEKGLCALDLETNGLSTRRDSDGESVSKIVGVCLATSADEGVYIPVAHEDKDYNVPVKLVVREIARLCANCRCIFHNFKFDGQLLKNYGIIIEDDEKYEDTMLMAAVEDASRKNKKLKYLSGALLGREMIEIDGLDVKGSDNEDVVAFALVPPQKAVYYGSSDAMCTFGLYEYFKTKIDEQDPTKRKGPWNIYKIEKRCLFVTMEMERNLSRIDREYLNLCREDVLKRMEKLVQNIYEVAGREFDIDSPKQLGILLFEEMKIPYPSKEKTKSGQYATGEKVLELIANKYPIIDMILTYRGYGKIVSTYIDNFLNNADENGEIKFALNQVQADTGRYSASGGRGLQEDGYSGVNCQNIPNYDPDNPNSVDLRKAVIAHPGYKIVSVDYSGEELRIAADLSREPKWIEEFTVGSADLHTKTAKAVTGKTEVTKKERKDAKSLNFHILYGGGAGGFAARAKIPYETAKKMLINFFKEFTSLKKWIDREIAASRQRKYSLTAMGRRRPLHEFYDNSDPKIQAKGDRCAVNSAIQGCLQFHERVLTDKGYLSIQEVSERKSRGIPIKVWTGTTWADFCVIDRGKAQFAEIVLSNGMSLDCDTRHEVLVVGPTGYVFKKYDELTEKDLVCVSIPDVRDTGSYPKDFIHSGGSAPNSKTIEVRGKSAWDFMGYFLGYTIGDGTIYSKHEHNLVNISFGRSKLIRNGHFIRDGIKRVGLTLHKPVRSNKSKGESYSCCVYSKALVAFLEYMGHTYTGAINKRVPNKLFLCPVSMRKEFLRGIFDTDCAKKPANRYSFHTPNVSLLRDIQLLGWTLGLSSVICETGFNTYRLDWSDLAAFERFMGLEEVSCKSRRTNSKMLLPHFLHGEIYARLKNCGTSMRTSNDRTLLYKLNKGKPVTIQTVLRLLRDYGIERPEMYFHYPLKRKVTSDVVGNTYTLSVDDPGHRFDSAGIISKNTAADIIKIALYRLWKWIHNSGLENDIRMLAPVHDEIFFEIKEDKLEALIPEICEIMRLRDVVSVFKWPVPLEVDAEYGDSWHVNNDFWKEHKASKEPTPVAPKEEIIEPKPVETAPADIQNPVSETAPVLQQEPAEHGDVLPTKEEIKKTEDSEVSVVVPKERLQAQTTNDATQYYINITVKNASVEGAEKKEDIKKVLEKTSESKDSKPLFHDAHIKERIDARGYFNYPLEIDSISARKLRFILETLIVVGDSIFIGPRHKVCVLSKTGEVYCRTSEAIAVDAFVALCLAFNI